VVKADACAGRRPNVDEVAKRNTAMRVVAKKLSITCTPRERQQGLQDEFKKLRPVSLTPRIHRGVGRGLCVLTLSKGFHRAADRFRAFLNSPWKD